MSGTRSVLGAFWSSRSRALVCLLVAMTVACAAKVPPPVSDTATASLGPKEGFVILDIDVDVAVAQVTLNRFVAARNLPKGRHRWIVRVPAGNYRWVSVELGSESGNRDRFPVSNMYVSDSNIDPRDEFEFEVVAGVINYPGSAIIRTSDYGRSFASPINFRVRNHSAMAVRALLETHAGIFAAYPVHYAGGRGDTFLEHWEKLRRDQVEATREAARDDEVD